MADEPVVWKPHVTVATVIEEAGRFLLVEESVDDRLVLNQPAGHLERGETLVQAAVRETLEEAAVEAEPEALIAVYRWAHPIHDRTFLRFTFAARPLRHHPDRTLDEEIRRTLWLRPEEVAARAERLRSPMVQRSIADHLAGRRYPLDLLQEPVSATGR